MGGLAADGALANEAAVAASTACWPLEAPGPIVRQALQLKEEGNRFLREGRHGNAEASYAAGLRAVSKPAVEWELADDPAARRRASQLALTLHLNLAQACLRLADDAHFERAIEACNAALSLDPGSVKALYRRAVARARHPQGNLEVARVDLRRALELEPRNREVREELTKVTHDLKKSSDRFAQDERARKGWLLRAEKMICATGDLERRLRLEALKPQFVAENASREARGRELLIWDEFVDLEAGRVQKQRAVSQACTEAATANKYSGSIVVDLASIGRLPNANDAEVKISSDFHVEIQSPCVGGTFRCHMQERRQTLREDERAWVLRPPSDDLILLVRQAVPLHSSQFRPSGCSRVPDHLVEDIAWNVGDYVLAHGGSTPTLDPSRPSERQRVRLHHDYSPQSFIIDSQNTSMSSLSSDDVDAGQSSSCLPGTPRRRDDGLTLALVVRRSMHGRHSVLVLLLTVLRVHKLLLLKDPDFLERETSTLDMVGGFDGDEPQPAVMPKVVGCEGSERTV